MRQATDSDRTQTKEEAGVGGRAGGWLRASREGEEKMSTATISPHPLPLHQHHHCLTVPSEREAVGLSRHTA